MKEMAAAGSQQEVCVGEREGSEGLADGEEGTTHPPPPPVIMDTFSQVSEDGPDLRALRLRFYHPFRFIHLNSTPGTS